MILFLEFGCSKKIPPPPLNKKEKDRHESGIRDELARQHSVPIPILAKAQRFQEF